MKTKTLFYCTDCGNELLKWQGRCPACGAWNTIVEQPAGGKSRASALSGPGVRPKTVAKRLREIEDSEELRFQTGMCELDRCWAAALFRVLWCSSAARPESENLL